jgi:hypothetical protein
MKLLYAFVLALALSGAAACNSDFSPSTSFCVWDYSVNRCRASNGQLTPSSCCGR